MIPTDRPVIGKDLDTVRQHFGLMMADAIWLYGLSPNKWTTLVRQQPNEPIPDPTLALLVRFLDQHPELSIIPRWPSPRETYDCLNVTQKLTQGEFSLLLGFERSAAPRWFNPRGARQSATLSRLMLCLRTTILSKRPEDRGQVMDDWRASVTTEAKVRGVDNLFEAGRWPTGAANDEIMDEG